MRFQRERYPACHGQSRLDTFPDLLSRPRPYRPTQEQALWHGQLVIEYLATLRFQRKVEVNGRITLFSRHYSLGRPFKGRTVALQMDAHARQWVAYDDYGKVLRRFDPIDLTYEVIADLALTARPRP